MAAVKQERKIISVKVSPELLLWLKEQASAGCRSMSSQAMLLLNEAKVAQTEGIKNAVQ